MKNQFTILKGVLLLIAVFVFSSFAPDKPAYLLYNAKGKPVKYAKMISELNQADMVFFGELHNNPIAHWMELELTNELYNNKKQNLVLGAEMFEADLQEMLNNFLTGKTDEKTFEASERLWKNYKTDYKPLVLAAKNNNLPFIATNVPRKYASLVNKKGLEALDTLPDTEKAYIAPLPIKYDAELACYKKMMEMMATHGGPANPNFPKAQAIKDATMAHFMLKNWSPGKQFLHYNGSYHSDNHQGIIWYLKQADSALNIKTVAVVLQKDLKKLEDEYLNVADYIIVVPDNMTTTY